MHTNKPIVFRLSGVLLAAAVMLAPARAFAQDGGGSGGGGTDSAEVRKLRDEFAAQKKELDAIKKELGEARKQLTELKGMLSEMRGMLERILRSVSPSPNTNPNPAPTAQLPVDPFACPDCLLAELRKRYAAKFGKAIDPSDNAARRDRLAEVGKWVRDMNHDLRGKARWLVRVESLKEESVPGSAATLAVTYTILDPTSRATLGSARTDIVPSQFQPRLKAGGEGMLYEVGLWASADIKFNENRPDEGIFNTPMLLAPYVEWGMKAEWNSVEPIDGSGGDRKKKPDSVPR